MVPVITYWITPNQRLARALQGQATYVFSWSEFARWCGQRLEDAGLITPRFYLEDWQAECLWQSLCPDQPASLLHQTWSVLRRWCVPKTVQTSADPWLTIYENKLKKK